MRILIVEDDLLLGDGLASGLRSLGFVVDWFRTGDEARPRAGRRALRRDRARPRACPAATVSTCLARWRARGETVPVLILTAREALESRVEGLDAGADDYLVKPIALEELAARLRAVARRARGRPETVWRHGALEYRPAERTRDAGTATPVELTAREAMLLELFLANPGRVLSAPADPGKALRLGRRAREQRARGLRAPPAGASSRRARAHRPRARLRARSGRRRRACDDAAAAPADAAARRGAADLGGRGGHEPLRARHEINELFDTQQIRLAQQVLALVQARRHGRAGWGAARGAGVHGRAAAATSARRSSRTSSIAVWSVDGTLRLADREGAALPFRDGPSGFVAADDRRRAVEASTTCARPTVATGSSASAR